MITHNEPELSESGFVLVEKGLLDIIRRVKFGRFKSGRLRFGSRVVARENAAVFSLDSPNPSLVVHL